MEDGVATYIVGDFNVDYLKDSQCNIVSTLQCMGFEQQIKHSTHQKGGLIDHVYTNTGGTSIVQESVYFSDHDIIYVTEQKEQ